MLSRVSKQIVKQRAGVAALILGLLMGFSSVVQSGGQAGASSTTGANAGEGCVRETGWMRRNHMELLRHDRDRTLRQGIRPVDGSIKECVNCHAEQDDHGSYLSVNAEGQFCSGCHTFASVSIDCFECHTTTPDLVESAAK